MTGPQMSSLTVITHLNNTDTGSASSPLVLNTSNNRNNNDNGTASFHQVVTNAYANPDGYTVVYHFFRGSQTGVVLNLPPGIYSVSDQSSNNTNNNTISNKTSSPTLSATSSHLTHTYSGDCNNVRSIAGDMVGYGPFIVPPRIAGQSGWSIVAIARALHLRALSPSLHKRYPILCATGRAAYATSDPMGNGEFAPAALQHLQHPGW